MKYLSLERARSTARKTVFPAIVLLALWAAPAVIADITNTVKATGIPERGVLRSTGNTTNVPVEQSGGRLAITQDLGGITTEHGLDSSVIDEGDSAWFTVELQNTGTAPIARPWPTPSLPTFDGKPGTGEPPTVRFDSQNSNAIDPKMLQPGETARFYVIYILSRFDILRGARNPEGMQHHAEGDGADGPPSNVSVVAYQIPADPHLVTTARVDLEERFGNIGDGAAATGDLLTYTYFVENVGNVPIRRVTVSDIHEEADPHRSTVVSTAAMRNETLLRDGPLAAEAPSTDAAKDGAWDNLEPGGVVVFTMTRTVTEAEYLAR